MRLDHLLIAGASLLAGCTSYSTVYSAVSDSAAVRDARLVGRWVTTSEGFSMDSVAIDTLGRHQYRMRWKDEHGDSGFAEARLSPFGTRWLLDLVASGPKADVATDVGGVLMHWQALITFTADSLEAVTFDADSLKHAFLRHRLSWGHVILPNGDVLLTDSTPRLRAELVLRARVPGALTEPQRWRRIPAGAN